MPTNKRQETTRLLERGRDLQARGAQNGGELCFICTLNAVQYHSLARHGLKMAEQVYIPKRENGRRRSNHIRTTLHSLLLTSPYSAVPIA